MAAKVTITGAGEAIAQTGDSLETLIFHAAKAALDDAAVERGELDGVVIAASDQTDGRAISAMLTSGPAGAYLNDEINVASSPGHALALAYMQIASGTYRRLLVTSWGKVSESANGPEPAERLSAEPFFERDAGLSSLAAAAIQAGAHRRLGKGRSAAAAAVAARNHGTLTPAAVEASAVVALPLRALEIPPWIDGAYSVLLEAGTRDGAPVLSGVGWCSDAARVAERDLVSLPHLRLAAESAYREAGIRPADLASCYLHDYTPDAEILAYSALGLCAAGDEVEFALHGALGRVNPDGGSVRGEAPFGGSLRKVLEAVHRVRYGKARNALAQMSSGFAGQFQTVAIIGAVDE